MGQGDLVTARHHAEQALLLAKSHSDQRALVSANCTLAQLCRMEGDLDAAEPLYAEAQAMARAIGDRESIAITLLNLAMVAVGRNDGDRARPMLLEALTIAGDIGSKPAGQSALEVAAGLASLREDWPRAARCFGAAEALMAQTSLQRDPADEAFLAPLMTQAREAFGAAAFDAAVTSGRLLGYEEATAEVRSWLEAWD